MDEIGHSSDAAVCYGETDRCRHEASNEWGIHPATTTRVSTCPRTTLPSRMQPSLLRHSRVMVRAKASIATASSTLIDTQKRGKGFGPHLTHVNIFPHLFNHSRHWACSEIDSKVQRKGFANVLENSTATLFFLVISPSQTSHRFHRDAHYTRSDLHYDWRGQSRTCESADPTEQEQTKLIDGSDTDHVRDLFRSELVLQ